eukprot:Clim_evm20s141 gene=Clim_evmTU20s141
MNAGDYERLDDYEPRNGGFLGGLKSTVRCIRSCLCCCCCTGPVCVIVGILFLLAAFKGAREDLVVEYGDLVHNWQVKGGARDSFGAVGFQFTDAALGSGDQWLKTTQTHPHDPINDHHKKKLPTYTSLVALADGLPIQYGTRTATDIMLQAEVLKNPKTRIDVGVTLASWIPFQRKDILHPKVPRIPGKVQGYKSKSSLGCRDPGDCDHISDHDRRRECKRKPYCTQKCEGQYDRSHQRCYIPMYLQSVCLSYDPQAAVFRNRWTGGDVAGCFYEYIDLENSFLKGIVCDECKHGMPGRYSPHGIIPSDIRVTVRHIDDPYLFVSWATNGYYDFGLTRGENFSIAIPFIIVGLFFTTSVIVLSLRFKRWLCGGSTPDVQANSAPYPDEQTPLVGGNATGYPAQGPNGGAYYPPNVQPMSSNYQYPSSGGLPLVAAGNTTYYQPYQQQQPPVGVQPPPPGFINPQQQVPPSDPPPPYDVAPSAPEHPSKS